MPLTCKIPDAAMPAVEMIRKDTLRPGSTWLQIGINIGSVMRKRGTDSFTGPWVLMVAWLLALQAEATDAATVVEAIWPVRERKSKPCP